MNFREEQINQNAYHKILLMENQKLISTFYCLLKCKYFVFAYSNSSLDTKRKMNWYKICNTEIANIHDFSDTMRLSVPTPIHNHLLGLLLFTMLMSFVTYNILRIELPDI